MFENIVYELSSFQIDRRKKALKTEIGQTRVFLRDLVV